MQQEINFWTCAQPLLYMNFLDDKLEEEILVQAYDPHPPAPNDPPSQICWRKGEPCEDRWLGQEPSTPPTHTPTYTHTHKHI